MELREYALSIVASSRLEDKLQSPPDEWTDAPGRVERLSEPGRVERMRIRPASEVKVPRLAAMRERALRPRILHALANHELQAVELFAWALLAFPDAPAAYRRGLLAILVEEQRHFGLYVDRIRAYGSDFGEFPVTGYFWRRAEAIRTPLQFACTMGLTFENANLDFACDYRAMAREVGDLETAEVLDEVHADEVRHVAFGWRWLQRLKQPQTSMWDAYVEQLEHPLGPEHARGKHLDVDSRRAAGFDEDFIRKLEETVPRGPGGVVRKSR